jgi:small subunit ribosomal protein S4
MIQGPKFKICRRLGPGVHEKCQTQRFVLSEARRGKKGGRAGKKPKALSEFGLQLIEKQKIRFSYGVSEKQFSNYVKDAIAQKAMPVTEKLYQNLEKRLDNVVYRLGLSSTRPLARQMVSHGHIMVNGKRTKVPSYQVNEGDVVTIREGSKASVLFAEAPKKLKNFSTPSWLSFDADKIEAKVTGKPKNTEGFLNFNAVLEFYSR